ncbi:MAG: PD-(D/E)XK nuclease superfamily protein [Bacteroidota bacterium]
MTDGNRANKSGRVLENVVETIYRSHGYEIIPYVEYARDQANHAGKRLLLKHVPYTSIYGHAAVSEFVAVEPSGERVRIECKWQQSSGSVDEKFVYLNAVEAMPEERIIILVDGGGAKPNAVAWLKHAAAQGMYQTGKRKTIRVMGMAEFTAWANAGI